MLIAFPPPLLDANGMVVLKELEDEPATKKAAAIDANPNVTITPHSTASGTTTDRIKIFRRPYAHFLINHAVNTFCSECFKKPELVDKLMTCSACSFARYCSKDCQKQAWRMHKEECGRLKIAFPKLPMTEVMFLSRIIDRRRFIEAEGDKGGWEAERKFDELIGHHDEIKKDASRMERFAKIFDKLKMFRIEEMSEAEVFDVYCKSTINSHTIQSMQGEEVGLSLDLGVSRYDHSCRPNCSMLFDGYYAYIRPLTPDVNPNDYATSTISYTDVGRSRYQRRKDLREKWYFECHCERCEDPADDLMTAIRCKNILCDEPILIAEDSEPKRMECPKCKAEIDFEYVVRGQQTMLELPTRYSSDDKVETLKEHLERARPILHEKNVYLSRLETAILHISGKLGDNIASLYSKVQSNFSACFPATESAKSFGLVEHCAQLIREGKRSEAAPVAFDAMCLLEASLGLSHPNYLRVLALWTFLDKKADKTDDELLELCRMDENAEVKPIDLSEVLQGVTFKQATE
ncbi:Histone-lysine N-methyltransferase SMYD3 [Aphelenchoides fujianensis]|nr:Histone-lysine N-methyltransferase SMYD3 [Aphelenchoides fujianensis]